MHPESETTVLRISESLLGVSIKAFVLPAIRSDLERLGDRSFGPVSAKQLLDLRVDALEVQLRPDVLAIEVHLSTGGLADLVRRFSFNLLDVFPDRPFRVAIDSISIEGAPGQRILCGRVVERTRTKIPRLLIESMISSADPALASLLTGLLERSEFEIELSRLVREIAPGPARPLLDSSEVSHLAITENHVLIELTTTHD